MIDLGPYEGQFLRIYGDLVRRGKAHWAGRLVELIADNLPERDRVGDRTGRPRRKRSARARARFWAVSKPGEPGLSRRETGEILSFFASEIVPILGQKVPGIVEEKAISGPVLGHISSISITPAVGSSLETPLKGGVSRHTQPRKRRPQTLPADLPPDPPADPPTYIHDLPAAEQAAFRRRNRAVSKQIEAGS